MKSRAFVAGLLCIVTISLPDDSTFQGGWVPDLGNGRYRNPVIFADYSDPDVIRVDDEYTLVSSSFNYTPGLPVLQSHDLVNWTIVSHVFDQLPSPRYDKPLHGYGCWAPSLRFHEGEYYVYYGDPDLGVFMSKTKTPTGVWEPLTLVKAAKGWIDPCPFWDDDGNAYLVHAWAKSRAGFNSILTLHKMSADGKSILDTGVAVFDGHKNHPTIEGPKLYKREGMYYIFAPAGGVAAGWQTVLRSKNIFGPYDDRIVLAQGSTSINGPHQGAWIETQSGESWFLHFQERGSYGRILHLQPMVWKDGWPIIGADNDNDGTGEPVMSWKKPNTGKSDPIIIPQTTDEFNTQTLSPHWQWIANHRDEWCSTVSRPGFLRLNSVRLPSADSRLFDIPNLLTQKFPAPSFTATASLDFHPSSDGECVGLLVMGYDYAALTVTKKAGTISLSQISCKDAQKGSKESEELLGSLPDGSVYLRVHVDSTEMCQFSFSEDGVTFKDCGKKFKARECAWVGARVGLFETSPFAAKENGYSDIDWFRVE